MQLARVDAKAVLVTDVDRDGAILPQISNVLIDESQRGIGCPFGENVGLGYAILKRQVEIQRRILRIGRPRCCAGKLGAPKERQLGGVRFRLNRLKLFSSSGLKVPAVERTCSRGS